jgi:cytochrome c peroxidase
MVIGVRGLLKCGTLVASAAVALLLLSGSAMAQDVPALQELGKRVFFDNISNPPRQSCSTCHVPDNGWTGGVAGINKNGVAIAGANPHEVGGRKPPSNAYASFSPPLGTKPATVPFTFFDPFLACANGIGPFCTGGVFWDGRAEGRAALLVTPSPPPGIPPFVPPAPPGTPAVFTGLGVFPHVGLEIFAGKPAHQAAYEKFIGPVADQALGPFAADGPEQNVPDGDDQGLPASEGVCKHVQSAKYAELFTKAWGEALDCTTNQALSFKRIALAVAAWQHSSEVNSFSSKRDKALAAEADGRFPLAGLTDQENLGHDLFYGRNDTGQNTGGPNGRPKNANCAACHNSHGGGSRGEEANQIYSDFAYHHIGLPANFEVENFSNQGDTGVLGHADPSAVFDPNNPNATPLAGHVKTPTLRNVDKRRGNGFPKTYMHNGYFKTLEEVVHFYNTSKVKPLCPAGTPANQAIANNCWPTAEFDTPNQAGNLGLLGNLGLTADEEAALVAYMKTLTDTETPKQPAPYKASQ